LLTSIALGGDEKIIFKVKTIFSSPQNELSGTNKTYQLWAEV
jgi:hypothetical protein